MMGLFVVGPGGQRALARLFVEWGVRATDMFRCRQVHTLPPDSAWLHGSFGLQFLGASPPESARA